MAPWLGWQSFEHMQTSDRLDAVYDMQTSIYIYLYMCVCVYACIAGSGLNRADDYDQTSAVLLRSTVLLGNSHAFIHTRLLRGLASPSGAAKKTRRSSLHHG